LAPLSRWCGDSDTRCNNLQLAALRPRIVTIHGRNVGPDLGDSYWGRRDRGRAPLGEQSGPDFYTTCGLTIIKVWSLLCDTALMSQLVLWRELSAQRADTYRFSAADLACANHQGEHDMRRLRGSSPRPSQHTNFILVRKHRDDGNVMSFRCKFNCLTNRRLNLESDNGTITEITSYVLDPSQLLPSLFLFLALAWPNQARFTRRAGMM